MTGEKREHFEKQTRWTSMTPEPNVNVLEKKNKIFYLRSYTYSIPSVMISERETIFSPSAKMSATITSATTVL